MKKVIYFIVGALVVITLYAIISKPSTSKVSKTDESITTTKNKNYIQKPKQKEPSFEAIVKKEQKKEKKQIKQKKLKEPKEQSQIVEEQIVENTLPPEYNDYMPVSSMDVAGNSVSIITDQKEEQSEDTPPSVPYLISGKVDGESFTITLPSSQSSRTNIVVVKTQSGKTITKPISPQELLKNGMIDIGEVDKTDDTNDEQSQNQEEDKTQDSGSIVPPQAPRI